MYISHWALNRKPFENTPDPAFLFFDSQHEEGLARMLYVVRAEKGVTVQDFLEILAHKQVSGLRCA